LADRRTDLIASLGSVSFADAWRNRVQEQIEIRGKQVPVWLLDLERRFRNLCG
jgi:hypothetical protein